MGCNRCSWGPPPTQAVLGAFIVARSKTQMWPGENYPYATYSRGWVGFSFAPKMLQPHLQAERRGHHWIAIACLLLLIWYSDYLHPDHCPWKLDAFPSTGKMLAPQAMTASYGKRKALMICVKWCHVQAPCWATALVSLPRLLAILDIAPLKLWDMTSSSLIPAYWEYRATISSIHHLSISHGPSNISG